MAEWFLRDIVDSGVAHKSFDVSLDGRATRAGKEISWKARAIPSTTSGIPVAAKDSGCFRPNGKKHSQCEAEPEDDQAGIVACLGNDCLSCKMPRSVSRARGSCFWAGRREQEIRSWTACLPICLEPVQLTLILLCQKKKGRQSIYEAYEL